MIIVVMFKYNCILIGTYRLYISTLLFNLLNVFKVHNDRFL